MGDLGEPGPVYVEIPTDVLRTHVPPQLVLDEWMRAEAAARAAARSRRHRRGGRGPLVGAAPAGHDRARRAAAPAPSWCACSTRTGARLSRHPGEPRPGAGRPSVRRRRHARRRDDRGRPRPRRSAASSTTSWATARRRCSRTPASCGIADNAGRAGRQPPRRARSCWPRPRLALAAMVEAAGNREPGRRPGLGRGAAPPASRADGVAPARAARGRGSDGKIHPGRASSTRSRQVADPGLHRHRRRRRPPELRPGRPRGRAPTWMPAPSAASASACRSRSPPRSPSPTGR